MSYILDALNKSEAERTRGARPTLGLVHHPVRRSRMGLWVVAAALIVNACIGAVWLALRDNPAPSSNAASRPPQPTELPAPPPALPAAAPSAALRPPPTPRVDPPAVTEAALDLSSFTFSTHVYSDDPTMRAVTLHGKRFVEGDMIATGVRLAQITETGVVLESNGRRVPLDVLQDWR